MAKLDGKDIVLKIGTVVLVGRTTGSINFSADMLDATTADSVNFKEFISGEKNATLSVGGLYDPEAAEGADDAIGYLIAGSEVVWYYGQVTTGGTYYTGNALISSVSIQGDKNTVASYTIELQNTGEVEVETVSGSV